MPKTTCLSAHHDATGTAPVTEMSGVDLGGKTLGPGVYHFGRSAALHGTLTLDGRGRVEPDVHLPDRLDPDHRHRRAGPVDQRRRRLRGVLGGRQLGDDRHGHVAAGQPDGPGQHHHDHRCDDRRRRRPERRPGVRSERRHHPRHQHDHRADRHLQGPGPDPETHAEADAEADSQADAEAHPASDDGADPARGNAPRRDTDPGRISLRQLGTRGIRRSPPLAC